MPFLPPNQQHQSTEGTEVFNLFKSNCFAWAAAVVNAELVSNIAKKSVKFFHL